MDANVTAAPLSKIEHQRALRRDQQRRNRARRVALGSLYLTVQMELEPALAKRVKALGLTPEALVRRGIDCLLAAHEGGSPSGSAAVLTEATPERGDAGAARQLILATAGETALEEASRLCPKVGALGFVQGAIRRHLRHLRDKRAGKRASTEEDGPTDPVVSSSQALAAEARRLLRRIAGEEVLAQARRLCPNDDAASFVLRAVRTLLRREGAPSRAHRRHTSQPVR